MKKIASTLAGRRVLVALTLLLPLAMPIIGLGLTKHSDPIIMIGFGFILMSSRAHRLLFVQTSLWYPGLWLPFAIKKVKEKNKNLDERQQASNSVAFQYSFYIISILGSLATWTGIILQENIFRTMAKQELICIMIGTSAFIAHLPSTILAWREKEVEVIE